MLDINVYLHFSSGGEYDKYNVQVFRDVLKTEIAEKMMMDCSASRQFLDCRMLD